MNTRIQHLIQNPFEVQLSDVALLQDEIEKYPYFSTLRALLLFGLKEFEHESYDDELKKTSIYSPSRVALYHYLQKEKQESTVEEIPAETIVEQKIISEEVQEIQNIETIEEVQSEEIQEPILEVPEETNSIEKPETKEVSTNQEMTFSQWLHLSKSESQTEEKPTEKDIKFQLIDEFIEKSPKISPVKISNENPVVVKNENPSEYSDLMTETLAQIYTEQKKYDKAIRAYKILSLKYPEKSDLFTEKIELIEHLKDYK